MINLLAIILYFNSITEFEFKYYGEYQVKKELLKYYSQKDNEYWELLTLFYQESKFKFWKESKKGACGIGQVIPRYWFKFTGIHFIDCTILKFNIKKNIEITVKVSKYFQKRCGKDWKICYRMGERKYKKILKRKKIEIDNQKLNFVINMSLIERNIKSK